MFAAYSLEKKEEESNEKVPDRTWLENDSFQIVPSTFSKESSTSDHQLSSEEDNKDKKKSKSKKTHKEKKKKKKKESSRSVKEERKPRQSPPKTVTAPKPIPQSLLPKGIVFSNGLHLKPHETFYEDCKGDRNNLSFPNLYFKYVAK